MAKFEFCHSNVVLRCFYAYLNETASNMLPVVNKTFVVVKHVIYLDLFFNYCKPVFFPDVSLAESPKQQSHNDSYFFCVYWGKTRTYQVCKDVQSKIILLNYNIDYCVVHLVMVKDARVSLWNSVIEHSKFLWTIYQVLFINGYQLRTFCWRIMQFKCSFILLQRRTDRRVWLIIKHYSTIDNEARKYGIYCWS